MTTHCDTLPPSIIVITITTTHIQYQLSYSWYQISTEIILGTCSSIHSKNGNIHKSSCIYLMPIMIWLKANSIHELLFEYYCGWTCCCCVVWCMVVVVVVSHLSADITLLAAAHRRLYSQIRSCRDWSLVTSWVCSRVNTWYNNVSQTLLQGCETAKLHYLVYQRWDENGIYRVCPGTSPSVRPAAHQSGDSDQAVAVTGLTGI